MTTDTYRRMLESGYEAMAGVDPMSRLEYLGEYIFGFTTYDGHMSELFSYWGLQVAGAINARAGFDFIERGMDHYRWFLLMCNMPFFADRLEWGTSIRGAWWSGRPGKKIKFETPGLWLGELQITEPLEFTNDEWIEFVAAMLEFAEDERP